MFHVRFARRAGHSEEPVFDFRPSAIGLLIFVSVGAFARGQAAADLTVRDKVYSEAQASRGKSVYDAQCASCHEGGGMGPSLTGDEFLASWDNKTVRALYSRVMTTMPSDAPGTLQQQELLDLMAYLVRANGFPPGSESLSSPDELNTIRIVRSK